MPTVLDTICTDTADHVAQQKYDAPLADIKARATDADAPRGFISALQNAAFPAIIAEVKKASPSKGIIRNDFDPATIARIYEDNGAACLSILTDAPYLQGADDYFLQARVAASLPALRKDFMIDEYQIHESRALGADYVLLIMAALGDNQAEDYYGLAREYGMDVLVETHDAQEIERALRFAPRMIGVNNRNLKTLDVSVQTCKDLAALIPEDCIKVAESGLAGPEILHDLKDHGYHSFLIGESLMREQNIGDALKNIRKSD